MSASHKFDFYSYFAGEIEGRVVRPNTISENAIISLFIDSLYSNAEISRFLRPDILIH